MAQQQAEQQKADKLREAQIQRELMAQELAKFNLGESKRRAAMPVPPQAPVRGTPEYLKAFEAEQEIVARHRPPSSTEARAQRPTEVQGKAAFNLERARAASQQLAQFDDVKVLDAAASKIPLVGNWIKTPEGRRLHNVGQAWAISVLRQDSGGAITESEMEQYFDTYLPKPGDDEQTLAQKRENRRVIESAMEGLAGPALRPQGKAPAADPEVAEVEAAFRAGPDTPERRAKRDEIIQAIRAKRGGE